MKKIFLSCVLIIFAILFLVKSDAMYLKSQENNWNDADYYIGEINTERERKGKSMLEKNDLNILTRYSGNNIYLTQVYVDDKLEMVFLTKAIKNSFFDWEYHTLPFVTTENIIEEALDRWSLN
jgi:hypothetical protein